MKLPKITLKWMRDHGACWDDKRLQREFFAGESSFTPQEAIERCVELKLVLWRYGYWILVNVAPIIYEDAFNCGYEASLEERSLFVIFLLDGLENGSIKLTTTE